MDRSSGAKLGLALVAVAALGACGSSAGGGGGSGNINLENFDERFDSVIDMMPTSDMPQELNARYRGAMKAEMTDNRPDFVDRELIADLDIRIDWEEGQVENPFSGTASRFRIREVGDDRVVRITGELKVDEDMPSSVTRTESTEVLPDGSTRDVASGDLTLPLSGEIADVEARVVLGGTFYGDEAGAAAGGVTGNYGEPDFVDADQFGTIDGDFFMERR